MIIHEQTRTDRARSQMALSRLVGEFTTYQVNMGNYVRSSASAVSSDFRGYCRFLSTRGVSDDLRAFNPELIGDYLASNRPRVRGSTLMRWIKSLNAFAKWAVGRKYLEQNPMETIQVGWVPTRRREFMFDIEGATRFLTVPVGTGLLPEVERVLRHMLVFGGLRRNEVLKRRWKDVDLRENVLLIYDSKNTRRKGHPDNLDRIVPIAPPLRAALLDLRDAVDPKESDPILFLRAGRPLSKDAFYDYFHTVRNALGLGVEFVPHCLRHSLSSNLVAMGATIADVALLLGHSSLQQDARRTVTDGYVTSSVARVRSFLHQYAEILANAADHALRDRHLERGLPASSRHAYPLVPGPAPNGWDTNRTGLVQPPFHSATANWDQATPVQNSPMAGRYDFARQREATSHPVNQLHFPVPGSSSVTMGRGAEASLPDPCFVAEAVALWKSLYPGRSVADTEFHHFLRTLFGQMNKTGPLV